MTPRSKLILISIVTTIIYTVVWFLMELQFNNKAVDSVASDTSSVLSSESSVNSSINDKTSSVQLNISSETISSDSAPIVNARDFTVGMWFSMYELNFKGMTEAEFQSKVDEMFDNAKSVSATDLYIHVRPSADAYYESQLFPFSSYFGVAQGEYPGFDPLKYMVFAAHQRGMKIHAWINPYRVANHNDLTKLAENNIAKIWLTDDDPSNDRYVLVERTVTNQGTENEKITEKLYFNPAIPEVREYVINGVKEILDNYDVDGIQIDDYFYPTDEEYFDEVEYAQYLNTVTDLPLSLGDWRRANVNALVSGLYSAVHNYEKKIFGISPAAHVSTDKSDTNYLVNFADVTLWMSTKGYCDYIAPQLYFGYQHKNANYHFDVLIEKWTNLSRHEDLEIIIGLAPYKIDPSQRYASDGTEWTDDKEILSKQVLDTYNADTNGVALYSYSYVCTNKLATEHKKSLQKTLNDVLNRS